MDDRTLEAAAATIQRYEADACKQATSGTKTYRVVVLGLPEALTIKAANAEERGAKMAEAGIDLVLDSWAAGYLDDHRRLQVCGNDAEARAQLHKLLRRR